MVTLSFDQGMQSRVGLCRRKKAHFSVAPLHFNRLQSLQEGLERSRALEQWAALDPTLILLVRNMHISFHVSERFPRGEVGISD